MAAGPDPEPAQGGWSCFGKAALAKLGKAATHPLARAPQLGSPHVALSCSPALQPLRPASQDSVAASDTFFADLGTYLTLERAQRLYGFQAERCAAVPCG